MQRKTVVKWVVVIGLFLGSVVGLGARYGSDDGATGTGGPAPHASLQSDADMTQQMSTPNANTGAPVHNGDAQLRRSQSPGYVRALELHQAEIDRMLARETP